MDFHTLNIGNPSQFLLAKCIPLASVQPESVLYLRSTWRQLPFQLVFLSPRNPWIYFTLSPTPLIVKHKMYKKFLKICAGLWFIFMNGSYSSGRLLEAAEHYEAFHQLTQGRIWKDEAGRFLNLLACESLLRTYRLLSDKMLENKDYTQAIRILIKASEIAKEGKWERTLSHGFL